jgi:NAD(P)-dependent dehydrogenase (short-subunit alcohol dehydrogenase family)
MGPTVQSTKHDSVKILVTGGSSGVGQAVVRRLRGQYQVHAPDRAELDLGNFEQIDQYDLGQYDVVINCAGANAGAYLGWLNNNCENQSQQVSVNFTGALLLAKQYVKQQSQGQFVFVTSYNIEDPIALNIFYTASKAALRYSMQTLRREFPGILFTEICPGKIKTNMLKQNYQGAKTDQEIEQIYAQSLSLEPDDVAKVIETAVQNKLTQVTILPNEKT